MITPDEMSAWLEVAAPSAEDLSALTFGSIESALLKSGVVEGIRTAEIKADLDRAKTEKRTGIRTQAAAGTPAQPGKGAWIEYLFETGQATAGAPRGAAGSESRGQEGFHRKIFKGGEVLAVLHPPQSPLDGCTVKGRTLPAPKGTTPDEKLTPGEGTTLAEGGTTLTLAKNTAGYPVLQGGKVDVEGLVRIPDGGLAAYLTLYPSPDSESALTLEEAEALLAAAGVKAGLDREAIEASLAGASAGHPPRSTIVARGRSPGKGQDASVRYHFLTQVLPGTLEEDVGRIDFKEREGVQNAKPGDLLLEKTPAVQGEGGFDVFGKELPGESGKDISIRAADGVSLSEDGLRFSAAVGGAVAFGGGTLGVFQEHTVKGDVDYATGNLNMNGTLRIQGWVRSGFKVKAAGDVRVDGGVEDAHLEAGTNIQIAGGVIGGKTGCVVAGGDVKVRFLENANVRAKGCIEADSFVQSTTAAEGRLSATGAKGCILGGSAVAHQGVEANELGSRSGIRTFVAAGISPSAMDYLSRFERALEDLQRSLKKVGPAPAGRGAEPVGPGASKTAKLRRELALRETQLNRFKQRCALEASKEGEDFGTIRVRKAVHAGTVVHVKGYTLPVRESILKGGTFRLDTNEWVIKYV